MLPVLPAGIDCSIMIMYENKSDPVTAGSAVFPAGAGCRGKNGYAKYCRFCCAEHEKEV